MVFDPTTARPVQEPQAPAGFDISTAQPVQPAGAQAVQPAFQPTPIQQQPLAAERFGPGAARAPEPERVPTRAELELPELGQGGLLGGEDQAKAAAIVPALLTTTSPEEIGQILQASFPNIGIQSDEAGNILAANNKTGARVVLNKPGLTQIDILQGLGIAAAFTPAGRATTVLGAAGAAGATEAGLQAVQALSGGEFDPEAIGVAAAGGAAFPAVREGVQAAARAIPQAAQAVGDVTTALFKVQSPTKQRIARLVQEGSTDVETARFRLAAPGQPTPAQPTKLQEFLNVGGPRVRTDRVAVETINQGFDEGVIAAVKGSSQADKLKMQQMVDIMERGKKNKLFAAKNRPSDVAGDTLLTRVKVIRDANKSAGQDIDRVARGLKGQQVNVFDAVRDFGETLDNLGVSLVSNGKGGFTPDFTLSQLGPGDRGPLKEVIRQMNIRGGGGIDALDVHKMKRIIDNNVTFGKVKTGISGDAERALKSFRTGLDSALDTNFPDYNRANVQYSETIGALNSIQDVAGRKMNLSGGNADKALGTLLRRTLSNQQSRIRLIDSIDEIESVAKKHGGPGVTRIEGPGLGQDDLLTQVLFVDELDSVFGPVARTSFQGQIDQALKQGVAAATTRAGAVDVGLTAAGKIAERARGINEEGAFKAIKELLKAQE